MKKKILLIALIYMAIKSVYQIILIALSEITAHKAVNNILYSIFLIGIVYFVYKKIQAEEMEEKEFIRLEEEQAKKELEFETKRKEYEEKLYSQKFGVFEEPVPNSSKKLTVYVEKEAQVSSTDKLLKTVENFSTAKKPEKADKPEKTDKSKSNPKIVEEGKSKAEQSNNVIINEDGKPVVKPNYKMIASEWVKANFDLLNKVCNDAYAISGGSGSYTATIPKDALPAEKATWILIGKSLVADDDISTFKIVADGLEVTVD